MALCLRHPNINTETLNTGMHGNKRIYSKEDTNVKKQNPKIHFCDDTKTIPKHTLHCHRNKPGQFIFLTLYLNVSHCVSVCCSEGFSMASESNSEFLDSVS